MSHQDLKFKKNSDIASSRRNSIEMFLSTGTDGTVVVEAESRVKEQWSNLYYLSSNYIWWLLKNVQGFTYIEKLLSENVLLWKWRFLLTKNKRYFFPKFYLKATFYIEHFELLTLWHSTIFEFVVFSVNLLKKILSILYLKNTNKF